MTLFIIVYLIALFCYFFTRVSENRTYRAINKYTMATMYLVLAIITFFRKYEFVSYQSLYMAAPQIRNRTIWIHIGKSEMKC